MFYTELHWHCIYAFARCFCSKKLALHCRYDLYILMYSLRIKPIIYSLSFIQNWIKTAKPAGITQGFFWGVLASGQKTHFTQLHTAVLLEINTVSVRRRAHRAAPINASHQKHSWENTFIQPDQQKNNSTLLLLLLSYLHCVFVLFCNTNISRFLN